MRSKLRLYELPHQVDGDAYFRLLEALLNNPGIFGLVRRHQMGFSPSARQLYQRLRRLRKSERTVDRWPGTRLFGSQATVSTFRRDASALPHLESVGSLYGWHQPDTPEDLFFAAKDGTLELVTISHERQGWILSKDLAQTMDPWIHLEPEFSPYVEFFEPWA